MAEVCAAFDLAPSEPVETPPHRHRQHRGKGVDFMEGNVKWHGGGIVRRLEQACYFER